MFVDSGGHAFFVFAGVPDLCVQGPGLMMIVWIFLMGKSWVETEVAGVREFVGVWVTGVVPFPLLVSFPAAWRKFWYIEHIFFTIFMARDPGRRSVGSVMTYSRDVSEAVDLGMVFRYLPDVVACRDPRYGWQGC